MTFTMNFEQAHDTIAKAVQTVSERIGMGQTTVEQYQADMADLIRHLPDQNDDMARLCARVLVRISLACATLEECELVADPDPDALDYVIAPVIGEPFRINRAQLNSLYRKYKQNRDGAPTFEGFTKRVVYGREYIMLPWCGMWLGIEKDGYTHS